MPRVESQVEQDRTGAKPREEHERPKAIKVLTLPYSYFIVYPEHSIRTS